MKRKFLVFIMAAALTMVSLLASATDQQQAIAYYNNACALKGSLNDPMFLFREEQLYKKAIELWPEFPEAHNNLGDVYERAGLKRP